MKSVVAAICIVLFSCVAHAFDFKGITLGAMHTTEEVREKLGVQCGEGFNSSQVCNGSVTAANEHATINLVLDSKNAVRRIYLSTSSDSFDVLAEELPKKFGKPTSIDRYQVQNRMNAQYMQVIYTWKGKHGHMVQLSRFAGSLDKSSLYFSTAEDRKIMAGKTEHRSGDL